QFAGVAPVQGAGTSDLVLRNVISGAFQVYNIANNQITGSASLGQVGLDWQLGGLDRGTNSSRWRPGAAQLSRSVTCTTPPSCFVPIESPLFSNSFSMGILSGRT